MNKAGLVRHDIKLIPASSAYAALWHQWRQESPVRLHCPVKASDPAELEKRLADSGSDMSVQGIGEYRWMVESAGRLVGTVSLTGVNRAMGHGEIGYMLGEEFHGRGIGTDAVRLLVEKIFQETDLNRLIAYVSVGNVASCRLLERVGFVKEGTLRDHYMILGKPVTQYLYGLLRREHEASWRA